MGDKKCPSCGSHFNCMIDENDYNKTCWCWGVEVSPYIPRMAQISKSISGCLCKKCLMNLPPLRDNPKPHGNVK